MDEVTYFSLFNKPPPTDVVVEAAPDLPDTDPSVEMSRFSLISAPAEPSPEASSFHMGP